MNVRQDIISLTQFYRNMRHPYSVTWNGRAYHDTDTNDLVNQVIDTELEFVGIAIRKLDAFNEDHAGELQELLFYRDYLSNGLPQ
ncbi:MAG: hypothetical protein QF577_01660 [Phycisphaerae bacterium]|jgi:hypothetical protein|nr:hypothetical protein [Phycisphaerae bacterium]